MEGFTPPSSVASYEGKAAPTRATLKQFDRGLAVLNNFGAEKSLDLAIERNDFCIIEFRRSEIFENWNFRKF